MQFILTILHAVWDMLLDASVFIIFGLLVGGLVRAFLNPNQVARHLGRGRFWPVLKAAAIGVPLPL